MSHQLYIAGLHESPIDRQYHTIGVVIVSKAKTPQDLKIFLSLTHLCKGERRWPIQCQPMPSTAEPRHGHAAFIPQVNPLISLCPALSAHL